MALIAGTLIALLAIALVLEPVIRPRLAPAQDLDDDLATPAEQRRDLALAALKEIEFDRATGKLSDADYASLKQKYTAEAVVALREPLEVPDRLTAGPPDRLATRKFCEECGERLEGSGTFCSHCGIKVAA